MKLSGMAARGHVPCGMWHRVAPVPTACGASSWCVVQNTNRTTASRCMLCGFCVNSNMSGSRRGAAAAERGRPMPMRANQVNQPPTPTTENQPTPPNVVLLFAPGRRPFRPHFTLHLHLPPSTRLGEISLRPAASCALRTYF
jgi:hypothetical protein